MLMLSSSDIEVITKNADDRRLAHVVLSETAMHAVMIDLSSHVSP